MEEIKNLSELIPGETYYLEINACREPGRSCRAKGLFTSNFFGTAFFENVEKVNEKPLSSLFGVKDDGSLSVNSDSSMYTIYKPVDKNIRKRVEGNDARSKAFGQVINKKNIPENNADPEMYKSLPDTTDLGKYLQSTHGAPLLNNNTASSYKSMKKPEFEIDMTTFFKKNNKGGRKSRKSKKSRKSRKTKSRRIRR
jgi:hypothetical protein